MVCDDIWVNAWLGSAGPLANVVADDCRFHNEANAVRRNGGIVVRIKREETTTEHTNHASEIEQDSIVADFEITNDSGVFELYAKLDRVLELWNARRPAGPEKIEARTTVNV